MQTKIKIIRSFVTFTNQVQNNKPKKQKNRHEKKPKSMPVKQKKYEIISLNKSKKAIRRNWCY